ncbi:MAG: hypothetical protein KME13_03535 [Myxacorys californica WJT36-NPBG1]|nr:hypothetical protein [Myxacorys californica WJT36-NPBG1]
MALPSSAGVREVRWIARSETQPGEALAIDTASSHTKSCASVEPVLA